MRSVKQLLSRMTLLAMLFSHIVFAADLSWLPQGSFFPTRYLDPVACQQSISILSYEVEGETQ